MVIVHVHHFILVGTMDWRWFSYATSPSDRSRARLRWKSSLLDGRGSFLFLSAGWVKISIYYLQTFLHVKMVVSL